MPAPMGRSTRAGTYGNGTRLSGRVGGVVCGVALGTSVRSSLLASVRLSFSNPTGESHNMGFRVASVPEPGSITLMLCGALAGLLWWKRSR